MAVTARDLLRQVAEDCGCPYSEVVRSVNDRMGRGMGLLPSVREVALEHGLDPEKYTISPTALVREAEEILRSNYARALIISAVLAGMLERDGGDELPLPAFFAFVELLDETPQPEHHSGVPTAEDIESSVRRVIELMTTPVSVVCDWSTGGIEGVAESCPDEVVPLAKAVVRRTKLYQAGLWSCLACKRLVDLKDVRGLLCPECDASVGMTGPGHCLLPGEPPELDRLGYGHTRRADLDRDDSTDEGAGGRYTHRFRT